MEEKAMTLEELFEVVDKLSPRDRIKLKLHLAELKPQTAKEWRAELSAIAEEFRGDSTDEEMEEIFAAMTYKNKPSQNGV